MSVKLPSLLLKRSTLFDIVILLGVMLLVVLSVKYFSKSSESRLVRVQVVGKDWSDLYFQYEGYRPPFWLVEKINVGSIGRSIDGSKNAEVVSVEKYELGGAAYDFFFVVKLSGVTNDKINKFTYQGSVVETGSPLTIRFDEGLVTGQVVDDNMPPQGYEIKRFKATVKVEAMDAWMAAAIKKGDSMSDGTKAIATITSIEVFPTSQQFYMKPGQTANQYIFEGSRDKRDLTLEVELLGEKHLNNWYFGGSQLLKVGNQVFLYLSSVDIKFARIVSLQEV